MNASMSALAGLHIYAKAIIFHGKRTELEKMEGDKSQAKQTFP